MRELVKFELSKIFQKKIIWIVAVLIAASILIDSVNGINNINRDFGNIEILKTHLKNYEGEINPQKQLDVKNKISSIRDKLRNEEKITEEESEFYYKSFELRGYLNLKSNPKYLINDKEYTLSEMKSELDNGYEDSYEYRNLEKAYKAISVIEKPQYVYQHGWRRITQFGIAATMIVILLVLGISTIFSDEYKTNVIPIILSTPNGRKKLTGAKIISSMIYASCVLIFISILFFLSGLPYGLDGFNSLLNTNMSTARTPYGMTIIQFYFVCLGMSLLGALVLTLFIALVSLLTKNSMITLVLGVGMYFFAISRFASILPKVVRLISVYELIQAKNIFAFYNSFNIFGRPVLYPTVIIIAAVIAIPTLISGIRYFGRRQSV
ncbi:ABC transporter permease [Oceanirhabdus seepicola]|uniref:ABC transporter permease n=1 Tax=Oceanirhabdus seepicola TaxID=2828781 RepID=A0A9J6P8A0_9CLOT|nr:ABC transporter permease [Oceanirhabdus seepicola]MCM1992246.1 ABC transporter permease [Oceanirhabdus seepicola]